MTGWGALLRTELLGIYRRGSEWSNPLVIFLLVGALFPLAISPEPQVLRQLGPGVIWIAALLAAQLSLEGLFRSEFEDGTLEQMLLSKRSGYVLVMLKVLARWLAFGMPLLLLSPLLATMLHVPADSIAVLAAGLLLGTPTLLLVGAIAAALVLTARAGGVLLPLLTVPLYLPVLIFGSSAVYAKMAGFVPTGQLLWLAALLVASLVAAPYAIHAALRTSLSGS